MMKLTLTFLLVLAVLEIAAKPRNALERSAHGQESNRNNKASRDDAADETADAADETADAADETADAADEEFDDAVNLIYCFKIKKGEMLRSINPISIFDALESSVITEETIEEMRNELNPENILFPQSARDLSKAENRDDAVISPDAGTDDATDEATTEATSDDAEDAEDFKDVVDLIYCFKIKKGKWP